MKNTGKVFEKEFRDSIPEDVYYKKMQDSANGFNVEDSKLRFAAKSPYDFFLYRKPNMWCLELKSISGTSISFEGKKPLIKKHQRKELLKAHCKGCIAGLVLHFRKYPVTYFVPIQAFEDFAEKTDKKSINVKDIQEMIKEENGALLINQEFMITHYRYAIDQFLDATGSY